MPLIFPDKRVRGKPRSITGALAPKASDNPLLMSSLHQGVQPLVWPFPWVGKSCPGGQDKEFSSSPWRESGPKRHACHAGQFWKGKERRNMLYARTPAMRDGEMEREGKEKYMGKWADSFGEGT